MQPFLTAKQRKLSSGELTARTFTEYRQTTDRLVSTFGKSRLVDDLAADDFESLRADIAKVWGPVRLGNEVTRIKTVFKYGYESGLIDKPVRYGHVHAWLFGDDDRSTPDEDDQQPQQADHSE